ncbi:SHOCT domain-containing protein [Aeromicrobium ginsengisoli]|nr:SHOCT domain-containing protein [Aeromicrobium ginsengisoli]
MTVSVNHGDTVNQICEMHLVISAPGVAPLAVEFSGPVKRKVWPAPGAVLPILVDPDNPAGYRILWDQVTPAKEAARAKAESVAALLRGEPVDAADDDVISRLERLAALRDSGAITEAEFSAQKAKVLG